MKIKFYTMEVSNIDECRIFNDSDTESPGASASLTIDVHHESTLPAKLSVTNDVGNTLNYNLFLQNEKLVLEQF